VSTVFVEDNIFDLELAGGERKNLSAFQFFGVKNLQVSHGDLI
jgi:hypothetical protein